MNIQKFIITKLWGIKNFEFEFQNNRLNMVAENGAGKSIVLKIFYYLLSKQWVKLNNFNFETVSIIVDNNNFTINKAQLSDFKNQDNLSEDFILEQRKEFPMYFEFIDLIENNKIDINKLNDPINQAEIFELYEIPERIMQKVYDNFIKLKSESFNFDLDIPIIFMPTYRRIEETFENSFGFNITINNKEKDKIETSKTFYEIWNSIKKDRQKTYGKESFEIAEFDIEEIIFGLSNNSIFTKKQLSKFVNICNKYFVNKKLVVNNLIIKLQINVQPELKDLKSYYFSSGEKQILSLFYYTIFTNKNYFLVIDEPELSVSIIKQDRLIPDLVNTGLLGFFMCTHSPFVYKNEYRNCTHAIREFEITD